MEDSKHKVFISFHHENDQWAKDELVEWNKTSQVFVDRSVDSGDISDDLTDDAIRVKIRDEYLKDSTVTILLVGTETAKRKHIDWELYSSMRDSLKNKKSGILVVLLPSVCGDMQRLCVSHGDDEKALYPTVMNWEPIDSRENLMWGGYEYLPERIVDNLLATGAKISVTTWKDIFEDTSRISKLINMAHDGRAECEYDLSRPMRRRNS